MSNNNEKNISGHWSGFRFIWWLVAILLAILLFLMWAMGFGPGGKSCQVQPTVEVRTVEKLIATPDTAAPLITLNDSSVVRLIAGETYTDAGARAVDDIDGNLTVSSTGTVDTTTPGEYDITYAVTDAAGNTTTEVRKVIVSLPEDTEAPEITLVENEVVHVKTGDLYVDEGAIATDIPDGEIMVITEGVVETSKAGEYIVTYTATDKAGNSSSKTRKVIVTDPDITAPVISLNEAAVINLKVGDIYTEAGAKAVDTNDGDLKVQVSGNVDIEKSGEYAVTYSATDAAGNTIEKVRKVIVSELDKDAPKLTLKGDSVINIKTGESYDEAGAKAVDTEDGDVSVEISGKVDTSTAGEYAITYIAKDKVGNTATETRTVIVTAADSTAPVITLNQTATIRLQTGESYDEAGAKAVDAEEGDVSVEINGKVDTSTAGEYIITYTAKDKAGNTMTETRKVIVAEPEPEPEPVSEPVSEPASETVAVVSVPNAKLYFAHDKANNPKDNDGSFAEIIDYLKKNNSATATINGFHDPSGDRNYNRGLANRRAETVSLIMMAAGVQSTRLRIKQPIETTGTGIPREARRVEVEIKN